MADAEAEATRPQADGHQPPLYVGRGGKGPPQKFQGECGLADTSGLQTSGVQNREEMHFYC